MRYVLKWSQLYINFAATSLIHSSFILPVNNMSTSTYHQTPLLLVRIWFNPSAPIHADVCYGWLVTSELSVLQFGYFTEGWLELDIACRSYDYVTSVWGFTVKYIGFQAKCTGLKHWGPPPNLLNILIAGLCWVNFPYFGASYPPQEPNFHNILRQSYNDLRNFVRCMAILGKIYDIAKFRKSEHILNMTNTLM